jgi:SAM-dependent methyltransferase
MIVSLPDGLLLDCGAGRRPTYYSNVVNYEIVDYDSTDVLGVGEYLPFKDDMFDAVISVAVLEHVCDPFRCATEISRVLKPGRRLICGVPFICPLHGYPHHYYNMTGQGLRALFEDKLEIEDHTVPEKGLSGRVADMGAQDVGQRTNGSRTRGIRIAASFRCHRERTSGFCCVDPGSENSRMRATSNSRPQP